MPLTLTVVTPSYNQGRFLEETIRSVVSQRESVHEYFVLDGGSSDNSTEVIRKYADGIDYWVSAKDAGQSDAIAKGFARATGDVICWLNSDDVFLPGALKKVRNAWERRPEWDVVTGYHASIDGGGGILGMHRIPREGRWWARRGIVHVCQPGAFFRRSLYESIGGLDQSLHCVMDTDLWYRMFEAGANWGHLPEFLACFRKHEDAKGSKWLEKYAEEYEYLDRRHPEYHRPGLRYAFGKAAYRGLQVLSGRHPRAALETRRLRGRHYGEVFGPFAGDAGPPGHGGGGGDGGGVPRRP